MNQERNALFMGAKSYTVFICTGCGYEGWYSPDTGCRTRGEATDAAFERGWRFRLGVLCNQCAEQRALSSHRRDVRPELEALKKACEEFCKCFCHSRDGLTVCPDCEAVHNSRDYQLKCKTCGFEQVYVRGEYPNQDNRLICPQCTQERLDDLTRESGSGQNMSVTEIAETMFMETGR